MQLTITGKQIDIGSALRTHVENRLKQSVGKYFDRPVDGSVTFSRDGHEYRADCTLHLSSGLYLQAHGRSTDIYASYDQAVERMEKRLSRYKSRIRDHTTARRAVWPMLVRRAKASSLRMRAGTNPHLNPVVVSRTRRSCAR
jgi:ribosomal subunit interface protein